MTPDPTPAALARPERSRAGRAQALPADDRRASIVEATIPLILDYGADVTTRQIAEAAGIAEGTVFRVFADKSQLIDAAIDSVMDPADTVRAIEAISLEATLEDKVRAIVMALQDRVSGVVRFMAALGPRDHERHRRLHGGHRRPPLAETTGAVERLLAPEAARLRVEPTLAAEHIRILVVGASMPFLTGGGPSDPGLLADLILRGVAGEGD